MGGPIEVCSSHLLLFQMAFRTFLPFYVDCVSFHICLQSLDRNNIVKEIPKNSLFL